LSIWTSSTKSNKQRTKTHINGGKEAIWEETFNITVQDDKLESVYFEVKNANKFKYDQLIGKAKFSCADVGSAPNECWIRIYSEHGADAGEVQIKASRISGTNKATIGNQQEQQIQSKLKMEAGQVNAALTSSAPVHQPPAFLPVPTSLPEGWSAMTDTKGRQYYMNHHNRTTQWEVPVISAFPPPAPIIEAPSSSVNLLREQEQQQQQQQRKQEERDLEERERELERQQRYFEQKKQQEELLQREREEEQCQYRYQQDQLKIQQEQQFQREKEEEQRQYQYQQEQQQQREQQQKEQRQYQYQQEQQQKEQQQQQQQQQQTLPNRSIPSFGSSGSSYGSSGSGLGALPPGWSQKTTPDGKIYYINHISNTTTWERPG
jgi:hypothetical protein